MTKNKDKETKLPAVTIGINNVQLKDRSTLIGKTISLNQKIDCYFGVGNLWLTSSNYYAIIPDTLSDEELGIVQKCLNDGVIVEGKVFIPPIDRSQDVLNEYWLSVKSSGLSESSKNGKTAREKFATLLKHGVDRGWTAYEIASFCLNKEVQNSNRSEVNRLLNEIIVNFPGEKTLFVEPKNL